MHAGERIAIVGLGGRFPGAADLEHFWRNVAEGRDASREVPAGRWCLPPKVAFDPRPATPDRVVSTRSYFLDPFEPDLDGLDIDRSLVPELDVLFQLALHIGNQAFRSARVETVDRSRVGVILASIALPTDRISERTRQFALGEQPTVHPLNRHVTGLPALLLKQALGLGGRAFTLDAACASSLYAIKLAVDELLAGRADAMLAGGLSRPDCLYTQMGFSQLRALSPSGRCSPFDAAADGLVVGEGGGVFVLKRLSDAVAHGDTIHGVIAGVGLSNDIEGNLLAPASEGQLRAMRAAYRTADWRPDAVDLIECHATGTPVGDLVEFQSLRELWHDAEPGRECVIGSVKSSVGHLLTGANAAGLMKVLLAMRHESLPPSANFGTPAAGIDLDRSPFRILDRALPWERRGGMPRRAAISGFGFGGVNAHLLVEEWRGDFSSGRAHRTGGLVREDAIAIVASVCHDVDRLEQIEIIPGAFPIPPLEMQDMLPQQLLLLKVAHEAWQQCSPACPERTGVFIGLELDIRTTFYHQRWWAEANGADRDSASPPLDANRTMGALASIAASRVARTFKLGGPSFSISSMKESSHDALDVAMSLLQAGEIDTAVVGAVQISDHPVGEPEPDTAAVVVLKRLEDAEMAGDQIYATVAAKSERNENREGLGLAVHLAQVAMNTRRLAERSVWGYWLKDDDGIPRSLHVSNLTLAEGTGRLHTIPGPEAIFKLAGESPEALGRQVHDLLQLSAVDSPLNQLAAEWHRKTSRAAGRYRTAVVAASAGELRAGLRTFGQPVPEPIERPEKLAFVYPGSGNHFPDMGRQLSEMFPQVLDRQQEENRVLYCQYAVHEIWCGLREWEREPHPRTILFAQVSVGTLITDLLRTFGVEPDAAIGYSLGESASLFGMRVWRDRDEMFWRLQRSSLFESDLAPPYNSARRQWGWPADRPIDWVTGVLAAPANEVEAIIPAGAKAYVLIVNTADECVVGGQRSDVEAIVNRIGRPFVEVSGVTTAHCEVAEPVREAYRELHHLPVTPAKNVTFYSGAWGRSYEVTSDSAADAITAAVLHRIDFTKVIEAVYRDGVRTFVEIGPGASCTRLIDTILADRPHRAMAVHTRNQSALGTLLDTLAELHVAGYDIDLAPLYDRAVSIARPRQTISIPVRPHPPRLVFPEPPMDVIPQPFFVDAAQTYTAAASAHEAFLRFSTSTQQRFAETIALQTEILKQWVQQPHDATAVVPRALSYEQCCEFAAGSIANVLGPEFAEADTYPTRVRLPDGPLMLVDRIIQIDGEPRSMTSGRVVTEHHVHAGRWYLDSGRIPVCVAVEAGQADLFLSGYLGIDFITRGLAVYRLLDAAITFHGPLPGVGATITYDIHIDRFFRQGDTHLFRFRFEGTVNGRPLLTMTNGCAGFFSEEELAGGKGIVQTELDRRPMPGKRPPDWRPLAAMKVEEFSEHQVDALRAGDLAAAFGETFASLPLRDPQRLPGGMLKLVDRVVHLDPEGGRFGLGMIRAEADIHPDDWFLTCHFVDDMVMPGTLMYECCLHALRIFLMRMGWVGEEGEVVCEPVPGVASKLKCRGQVIASTKTAAYEVVIKEIGYGPEPYALADALMYADGRPIVEMTNMSLRLSGTSREKVEALWRAGPRHGRETSVPLFDRHRITAFAIGKPSEAFGEPYKVFDSGRVIARLPGPPFQFLDRIVDIDAEPWMMVAGGEIVAEYDVPPDEWYFAAQRSPNMPFSVLLEIALQPCGWLAAYIGSALTSPTDLSFRNLGGKAIQHRPVGPDAGTLTTTVKITRVSSSGGMIIQHYDYAVRSADGDVYTGDTYFGFFSKEALANQVGLRELSLHQPSADEAARAWAGKYPPEPPFPDTMLRMVDDIKWYVADGGPNGLGAIEGRIGVGPGAWFFKAHFHQDPVWPGSLGLESFVQILKFLAAERWSVSAAELLIPAPGCEHRWVYRGQVIPTDGDVTVQAWVKEVDDAGRFLVADGLLSVDGRIIYQMTDFAVQG